VSTLTRAAGDQGYSWGFAINSLPNSSEFSSLFARYRIDKVVMDFVLTAVAGSATTVQYPLMYLAADYTDISVPASSAEIQQRKHMELTFSSARTRHLVTIRPRVNLGGIIQPASFMSSDISMEWYGLKAWIYNYNSTSADGRITLAETFYLSCSDEQ